MLHPGMLRADRDVIKETEPHRPVLFGMVSRRTDGTERRFSFSLKDEINSGCYGSSRMQRHLQGVRNSVRVSLI
jgi:hypothetical protein